MILTSRLFPTAIISCVLLCGCGQQPTSSIEHQKRDVRQLFSEDSPLPAGLWKSDGYGFMHSSDGKQSVTYHITENFCIRDDEVAEYLNHYLDFFTIDESLQTAKLYNFHDSHPIVMQHNKNLLEICSSQFTSEPLITFDAFVEIFQTHYPFFSLYNVDWKKETAIQRATLHRESTQHELFTAISKSLENIHDGHLGFSVEIKGNKYQFETHKSATEAALTQQAESSEQSLRQYRKAWHKHYNNEITDILLEGNGYTSPTGRMNYGLIKNDIGYISILMETGFVKSNPDASISDELAALRIEPDKALDVFQQAKAVIIDLSINYGGEDALSNAIASRFTDNNVLAYSKFAGDAVDQTPTQIYLQPDNYSRFTGDVYVITSDMTISAGESLTMALRALPNVTHVGEPTRGALSNILPKRLPNGWQILLTNEIFLDHEGKHWEAIGIPPEIEIEVFNKKDVMQGHLQAVETVIEIIMDSGA